VGKVKLELKQLKTWVSTPVGSKLAASTEATLLTIRGVFHRELLPS